jgi:hypothetical protein
VHLKVSVVMDVEFLATGSPDCPLIRIFGADTGDHLRLQAGFEQLARGQTNSLLVTEIPGFVGRFGCKLELLVSSRLEGVRQADCQSFVWALPRKKWMTVAEFAAAVADGPPGVFQWLAGSEARNGLENSGIAVLLSKSVSGHW